MPVDIKIPPAFCEYAAGHCDQDFSKTRRLKGIFLYPSEPTTIAATIETAVISIRHQCASDEWKTWRDLNIGGQVIFCTICKSMRHADMVVADVTTLNFNLLFEIGFAIGLEIPVVPVRDTTYVRDKEEFDRLGLLDTIGYLDFQNADGLATAVIEGTFHHLPAPLVEINREAPLYVLKGHIDTEGAVRLMSTLKKSALRFRTFDAVETPRLSLQEARRNVAASLGVVAHLLEKDRAGALVHNARCALIAGIAMATGKSVLLVQEGLVPQPIDYRDVVRPYVTPEQVPRLVEPIIRGVVTKLQDARLRTVKPPEHLLERLDLGDVAAENEIGALRDYFVRTAQYNDAKRGHARLVAGRKGAGKTAIFYTVRNSLRGHSRLVLDLKPEGHQFTKLREVVLSALTPGLQEHTLTAFWNYILLCELAQKIRDFDYSWAQRDDRRKEAFNNLMSVYERQVPAEVGDFSERLLMQVERISERFAGAGELRTGGQLSEVLFRGDIKELDDALAPYLEEKDEIWILVDNLDKGWRTRGSTTGDVLIVRTLLEATRKIQRQLERRGVAFHSLTFLRNDIYDHLIEETPDRGKETVIRLHWDDLEVFKEIVLQRIKSSTDLEGAFEDVWPMVFDAHVGPEDSFRYMVERTLMRPRDLLNFLHRAIEVAVNRGHEKVIEDDIRKAEEAYSEDIFLETSFEIRDVFREGADPMFSLLGLPAHVTEEKVVAALVEAGFQDESERENCLNLLVWFGVLGVLERGQEEPRFSYQVRYNVKKLVEPVRRGRATFVIHPAFRSALGSTEVA